MIITDVIEVSISHEARYVDVAESGHVVVMSFEGEGSLVFPDRTASPQRFTVPDRISGVAISPDGSLVAVAGSIEISVLATANFQPVYQLDDSFAAVRFETNDLLWRCLKSDGEQVIVDVVELRTGSVIAATYIEDLFGGAYVQLCLHGQPDAVFVYLAGGENGQSLFEARHGEADIRVAEVLDLKYCSPPAIFSGTDQFLVAQRDQGELLHYLEASSAAKGRIVLWHEGGPSGGSGANVCFAAEDYAVVVAETSRLLLIDLVRMDIQEEIRLEDLPGSAQSGAVWYGWLHRVAPGQYMLVRIDRHGKHPSESNARLLFWEMDLSFGEPPESE